MDVAIIAIAQQNMLFIALSGQEHLDAFDEALKSIGDLYGPRGKVLNPAFLNHVWGSMVYDCNFVMAESIRGAPHTLPISVKRDWLTEEPPISAGEGAIEWAFPTISKRKESHDFGGRESYRD